MQYPFFTTPPPSEPTFSSNLPSEREFDCPSSDTSVISPADIWRKFGEKAFAAVNFDDTNFWEGITIKCFSRGNQRRTPSCLGW